MRQDTFRRARAFAPFFVLATVALLVLLEGRHKPESTEPPTDSSLAEADAKSRAADTAPPVLVGRRRAARGRTSTLTIAELRRLGDWRNDETCWDIARKIVSEGTLAVPRLLEGLRSEDEKVRYGTCQAFPLIPVPAVPALVALLDDADPELRGCVFDCLGGLQGWWAVHDIGAEVVRRVAAGLSDAAETDQRWRLDMISAAGRHAALGTNALVEVLGTAGGATLEHAASAVGALGPHGPELTPVLVERLLEALDAASDDEDLHCALRNALRRLGPPSPADLARLASRLRSAPETHRGSLCHLFAHWGANAGPALPYVEGLLADPETRQEATWALVHIPGGEMAAARDLVGRATRPIDEYLDLGNLTRLGPRYEKVLPWLLDVATTAEGVEREAALRALGYAPAEFLSRVAPVLTEALRDPDDRVRLAAAWATFWRKDPFPGEMDLVRAALKDPSAEVRSVGLVWFRRRSEDSKNEAHAALVAPLLGDPDPDVRFRAGNVLKGIGTAPASALTDACRNLRDENRLVRIGALRALVTLGPKAAEGVPTMIEAMLDRDTEKRFGLWPLAETGVFDDRVKDAVREYMTLDSFGPGSVLRCFEERAAVFEPELRAHFLANPKCGDLYQLANVTRNPEALTDWILTHRDRFEERDVVSALASLDAAGLPALLEMVLSSEDRSRKARRLRDGSVRSAAMRLGPDALRVLEPVLSQDEPETTALVLGLLAQAAPRENASVFLERLASKSAPVRAEAAKGLAAAFSTGIDPTPFLPALESRLDDEAVVCDAAWQAITAAGRPSKMLRAKAEAALENQAARVQVAAAEALLMLGGDHHRVRVTLEAILNVPAPMWGWIGGGGTSARTEDEYSDAEKLWARAARALARMREDAAPAAETLVWAAIRHGEPLMQRILLGPILAMGPAAEPVLPLLDRLAATRGTWLGYHETVHELTERLEEIYEPFGREVPTPQDDELW